MAGFKEYDQYDGIGLARLVREGQVSASELCEEAISRIEQLNPHLNAVITLMFAQARATAKGALPDGAFKGVPFLLKDLLHAWAGVPLSSGSKSLKDFVPDRDAEIVSRFKRAGLIVLGKTNLPEFGLMAVTEPEAFGPTRNPWNLHHTPGGSSGGSAAAVASRIVPIASANDGGGSIRIPASCCGIFGLKPTRGRTPVGPYYGEVWDGAVSDLALSLSVRDSAALLDAVQGPEAGAPYAIVPPERPYLEEIGLDPGTLRIAFTTRSPIGTEVHPECVEAVRRAAALLESLGHRVEEAEPVYDGKALAKCYMILYFGQIAADLALIAVEQGADKARLVEDTTRTLALLGRTLKACDYVAAKRQWHIFGRAMAEFFTEHDLFLTPTTACPPVRIGSLAPKAADVAAMKVVNALGLGSLLKATGIVDKLSTESLSKTPFTQLANLTGLPAMSVPLHWTPDGLPCGVQFIGRFGDEGMLFRLAAQLEKASPWFDKRPPLAFENGNKG
ncbi:MAG: amidase [Syntrophobacteraceae bacterium]